MRHLRRAFERFVKGDASHLMVEQLMGKRSLFGGNRESPGSKRIFPTECRNKSSEERDETFEE